MPGSAHVVRADAGRIPLPDESVDLIVTSPPYFSQRSYQDHGEHYAGQIGSESHPRDWLAAMFAVMRECWRVLKPGGSCFVNLGDKRAGSGGHNNDGISSKSTLSGNGHTGGVGKAGPNKIKATPRGDGGPTGKTSILAGRSHTTERDRTRATRRTAPDRYEQAHFGRVKSRQALPERFLIGCIDGLADPEGIGWIWRSPLYAGDDDWGSPRLWWKANGIPESVGDRTRDDWEHVFHLTKQEHYFAAVDEIREPHLFPNKSRATPGRHHTNDAGAPREHGGRPDNQEHPLGKLPGSIWRIPSEPLKLPTWKVVRAGRTVQWFLPRPAPKGTTRDMAHFDALKWMRAMGLSGGRPSLRRVAQHFAAMPTEIPRRIILGFSPSAICTACGEPRRPVVTKKAKPESKRYVIVNYDSMQPARRFNHDSDADAERTILGYACACSEPTAPTRPSVILDPFSGTGTTPLVAKTLGRTGVGVDLSHSYAKVAEWRCASGQGAKAEQRTWQSMQGSLL